MKSRMNKIFRNDGKTFILAMDHGMSLPVLPELNRTEEIIKAAVANGVDAIICSYGIYKKYASAFGKVPAIIRGDGGGTQLGDGRSVTQKLYSAADILRVGGDAVVCMGFPGIGYEDLSLQSLQEFITECDEWGLPLCAEMLPQGWNTKNWTPENLKFVSRVGAEFGADIIKTQYTGDKESFKALVDGCYAPVVILGGPGGGDIKDLFVAIRDSLEVGGKGVAIGRSIWKQADPGKYCRAISSLIHEGASVEDAMKVVGEK